MCRSRRLATRAVQETLPRGAPRVTDCRTCCHTSSSITRFTSAIQLRGRFTGQGRSPRHSADLVFHRTYKLPEGHASARLTSLARRALASTYRLTVRKCASSWTGKLLNRPWYNGPLPAVRVYGMPTMGVRHRYPLHPDGQVGPFAGAHHEMPMVGHQTPRQELRRVRSLQGLGQHPFKRKVIVIFLEERQAHDPPIQNVTSKPRLRDPWWSPHAPTPPTPLTMSVKSS